VAYKYQMQDLFALLHTKSSVSAERLKKNYRGVERGLVSVGLKIHCLDSGRQFNELIAGLGGPLEVLEVNYYKDARASLCLVLPPVGSAGSAIALVECIEQFTGSPIFGNREIQLQLCSPGRLSARGSALLAIAFYLGSDTLRRYTQADLRTTFAAHFLHPRGIRLVLYDAEGDFDRDFPWWGEHGVLEPALPFDNGRTDLLIGSGSRLDVQNINLIATLLVSLSTGGGCGWRADGFQLRYAHLWRHRRGRGIGISVQPGWGIVRSLH